MSTATLSPFKAVAKRKVSDDGKDAAVPLPTTAQLEAKRRRFAELKQQFKDIEAEMKALSADMCAEVEPARILLSRNKGERIGSLKVGASTYITYHNSQRSFVDAELALIKPEFGPLYETYFRDHLSLEGEIEKLPDPVQQAIIDAGFEISVQTRAVKQLEDDRVLNETVFALCERCGIKPTAYFK